MDNIERKYVEALAKLPPWKCGRLDMNTYLTEPVQVGRVKSDVVRYVYFDDKQEVIVVGRRADEVAYAASKYRDLIAERDAANAEIARLREALNNIACWDEGPTVNGSFDEPGSARIARAALAPRAPIDEKRAEGGV